MNPRRRYAGTLEAILMMALVVHCSSTALGAQTSVAPQTPLPEHREITLEQRADIYMARKSFADAADYYYRALKEKSFTDPALWNKLGIAFQQQNKFHSARQAYSKAVHVDPNFAEAWNNLGTVFCMEKKYKKSTGDYQRAIKLKSDAAAFHMNLGTSYYHLKKFDQSVGEYRTALEIDPKVALQQSPLGTTIHAGGTDPDFYFYMAKAYASMGNAEESVRYLRRAMEDGFDGAKRIDDDPDFKKISQDPKFIELRKSPPFALKD